MGTEKESLTLITQEDKSVEVAQDVESEDTSLVSTLPPKMQRFIHLYMTGQYTQAKLAQLLEVHPNTLRSWLQRQDVKACIDEVQEQTHQMVGIELKALTLKATRKLHDLMDSPIDGVALQAVKDVLDRSGHKSKTEIKVDKTVTTIEEKMKDLIDETIIDAEFEEVE